MFLEILQVISSLCGRCGQWVLWDVSLAFKNLSVYWSGRTCMKGYQINSSLNSLMLFLDIQHFMVYVICFCFTQYRGTWPSHDFFLGPTRISVFFSFNHLWINALNSDSYSDFFYDVVLLITVFIIFPIFMRAFFGLNVI